MDLPDRVIGGAYRFNTWETLESLVDIGNRMAGSAGEQAAMETVADALREAGARDVGIEELRVSRLGARRQRALAPRPALRGHTPGNRAAGRSSG
ncbi:MAG: hypothetical protein J07HX64_01863 [halophilic archaeon J07HX64]|nr:MAG: hypothetical protein J07HX64_01863 [halophilic archaeon J07HX64]